MSSPTPHVSLGLRPDQPPPARPTPRTLWWETLVSLALVAVGGALAWGAIGIPSEAGYGGVGANFLPWVVALALVACGGVLLWQARRGGFRDMEAVDGDEQPHWPAFVGVSAGLLLNAALIERIGFVLGCALAYLLAVQGLRRAFGQRCDTWLVDALTGLAIAAPVFWLFRQLLAIHLPGLTATGWL